MTNLEFLLRHARAGRIGLVGGLHPVDLAIRQAQRALVPGGRPSAWSHAFLFQGDRVDGRPWLVESDLDVGLKQVRNGVQEHRVEKYADAESYPNLMVLDLGLPEATARRMVAAALDFVARSTRYHVEGILGTFAALVTKTLDRGRPVKDAVYCSSFVRALYQSEGLDLAPGIATRHTAPEHLARTPVEHRRHVLIRDSR